MKVLAVTCYTGDEALCSMTEIMLSELQSTSQQCELLVSVVAQGAHREVKKHLVDMQTIAPENVGFAYGMNLAIEKGLEDCKPDYVLCMNNDLVLSRQPNWMAILMTAASRDKVTSPTTDKTASHPAPGPRALPPVPVDSLSAYCWLVPIKFCERLKEKYGFWLFSEDFVPAYGEDDWTSYLLTKEFGQKAFRLVPRSFVGHLKRQTAKAVKHDRSKTSKTLADKFRKELEDPRLPRHLKAWATRYIKILRH
jgi:hypothetical protein